MRLVHHMRVGRDDGTMTNDPLCWWLQIAPAHTAFAMHCTCGNPPQGGGPTVWVGTTVGLESEVGGASEKIKILNLSEKSSEWSNQSHWCECEFLKVLFFNFDSFKIFWVVKKKNHFSYFCTNPAQVLVLDFSPNPFSSLQQRACSIWIQAIFLQLCLDTQAKDKLHSIQCGHFTFGLNEGSWQSLLC